MKGFKTIDVKQLPDNVFKLLDNDWMLVTAGTESHCNTMTASWGGFGVMWNKPVAVCVIRPQRHTITFVEENDFFTLSFFDEKHRDILNFCGKKSGSNTDKIKETGLKVLPTVQGTVAFEQARLVFVCKKLYADDIKAGNFVTPEIVGKMYPNNDFHRFFIGEIVECYIK